MSRISLLITHQHYITMGRKNLCNHRYDLLRFVEKYADIHAIRFEYFNQLIRLFLLDRYEATEICAHFWLRDVEFFDWERVIALFPMDVDGRRVWSKYRLQRDEYFWTPAQVSLKWYEKKMNARNSHVSVPEVFSGNFTDYKPRLWLFGDMECGVQGSFLR